MKMEKSCGGVIYKIIEGEIFVLLVKHNRGHFSFPKGHVEFGETEEETAIREIKEETGIDARVDINYRYSITYSPKENVLKKVIFFLGVPVSDEIKVQYFEVEEVNWFKIGDALKIITYNEDRTILKAALYDIRTNFCE